jgi:hypothetical protein
LKVFAFVEVVTSTYSQKGDQEQSEIFIKCLES